MLPMNGPNIRVAIIDNSIAPAVYKPVEHWASFLGVPFVSYRAPEGRLPEPSEKYTHVILTGSEGSILEREPWVGAEVDFVREAFDRGTPILGSCYGHQLLALALRGPQKIRRARRPEIGWFPIDVRSPNRLLGGEGTIYAFSSHFDEVIDLDGEFRVLASTPDCEIQAFEIEGRPVWGIQFHPEISIPAGREYLRNLVALGLRTSPLFEEALAMSARDSGAIRGIIRHFLDGGAR
jgi:GMP synthase-like glutamine amidotransferase